MPSSQQQKESTFIPDQMAGSSTSPVSEPIQRYAKFSSGTCCLLITIDNYKLDAVCQFTYLGSTITDNLSLDAEIDDMIGKAASTLARLTARVWTSPKLSMKTTIVAYNACVTSTLLYGSETWTTYAGQERRLNTFHLRSIRRILGISWQDKVTNADVLSHVRRPSMYTLLRQRTLRWLGHVRRVEDGRIPKDILYGELAALTCDIEMSA